MLRPRQILDDESLIPHGLEDNQEALRFLGRRGFNQTVVGTSPSLARLPCTMATCGVRHLGDRMLRTLPTPWAPW